MVEGDTDGLGVPVVLSALSVVGFVDSAAEFVAVGLGERVMSVDDPGVFADDPDVPAAVPVSLVGDCWGIIVGVADASPSDMEDDWSEIVGVGVVSSTVDSFFGASFETFEAGGDVASTAAVGVGS